MPSSHALFTTGASLQRRALAVVAILCLMAVGCGASTSVIDAASGSPAPAPLDSPPAPVLSGSSGLNDPDFVDPDGPQFGATVDEWSALNEPGALSPVDDSQAGAPAERQPASLEPGASGYVFLRWPDLIPPGFSYEEIYEQFEDQLAEVEYGSPEANALYEELQEAYGDGSQVNDKLDGLQIEMSGFVAPLSYDEDVISEFLLVPFFGACIHVPPPPPNQTVLVTLDEGMDIEDSYGPVTVSGLMTLESADTELAAASYTIVSATSKVYTPRS